MKRIRLEDSPKTPRVRLEEDEAPKRERIEEGVIPEWSEIEGWVTSLCQKQLWRCQPFFDLTDLIQEAALRYVRCCELYWHLDSRTNFCGLLRTAITNRLHDLATSRTKHSVNDLPSEEVLGGKEGPDLSFAELIDGAPPRVIRFFAATQAVKPDELISRRTQGGREVTVDRIARVMGVPKPEARKVRADLKRFVKNL